MSVAQPSKLGPLLRSHSLHLLFSGGREISSLPAERVGGLLLLIEHLMDEVHVWQHLCAGLSGSNFDVLLLLTDRGATLFCLVEIILVAPNLGDLERAPELQEDPAW